LRAKPHALKEIEHFFQVYKDLEGVTTRTRGFEGAEAARQVIVEAMAHYDELYGTAKNATGRKRSATTDRTVKGKKMQGQARKSRPR
jgi:hypothetical protein